MTDRERLLDELRPVAFAIAGEYMGIPPTGKSVTYNEIFIVRFEGGRIAETWGVVDVLSQMKQLGAIPV